ncbi:MAG TPA: hypothetical protein VF258_04385, partial [Luteolibacter sp.]
MKRSLRTLTGFLFALQALSASPVVKSELLKPGDASWKFKDIPGPSKSDCAQDVDITCTAGNPDPASAPLGMLVNGKLPPGPSDLSQSAFFAGASSFVMDLGKGQPITAVNSYSWHEFADDQGARGPQVYTLSGSNDQKEWTKIADVDTRPNKTGDGWAGTHGASVTDSTGKLGDFRYLRFDMQPTSSPKQGNVGWTNTLFDEIDVHSDATLAKAGDATVAEPGKNPAFPNLEEVIVTFKCHLDIGYTHTVPEVIEKYRGADMDAILSMFENTKDRPVDDRFRWMLPAWAMETVLDKDQTPERRAKLEQAVRDNRLMWHAIPYTFESDAADLEELVRGLGYGNRLSKRFGMPLVKDAKQTDMPEQAWVLPTLLKHSGVDFLHIGANDGSKPTSELQKIPTLSWWEGADGSRVLLGYSPKYGWGSIAPPKGWKHKTWLAFFVLNDNAGPPSPQVVEQILAQGRQQLPGVKIRFGRPSDFSDAIIAEEKANPTLPVIRADMPDTWCHGQMSTPEATGIHRRAAPLLGTLGQMDTTLRALGVATEPVSPLLEDGYKNGGFYAEHTWGLSGGYFRGTYGDAWKKKYDAGEYKKFDATYAYHMDYGRKAMKDAVEGLVPRTKLLAESVKCDGPRVVVFNPLPWERDATVEVEGAPGVASVTDLATGKPVAIEQTG